MHVNIFLKLLGAKKRNQIKDGKLWEVSRFCGMDISWKEQEVAKPLPFVKPKGGEVDGVRTHTIKEEDNVTNLTKNADLI